MSEDYLIFLLLVLVDKFQLSVAVSFKPKIPIISAQLIKLFICQFERFKLDLERINHNDYPKNLLH